MPRWWFDRQAGGGWLGAQGSHLIDQVRTWVGEFASLSAALPTVSAREDGAERLLLDRRQPRAVARRLRRPLKGPAVESEEPFGDQPAEHGAGGLFRTAAQQRDS